MRWGAQSDEQQPQFRLSGMPAVYSGGSMACRDPRSLDRQTEVADKKCKFSRRSPRAVMSREIPASTLRSPDTCVLSTGHSVQRMLPRPCGISSPNWCLSYTFKRPFQSWIRPSASGSGSTWKDPWVPWLRAHCHTSFAVKWVPGPRQCYVASHASTWNTDLILIFAGGGTWGTGGRKGKSEARICQSQSEWNVEVWYVKCSAMFLFLEVKRSAVAVPKSMLGSGNPYCWDYE